MFGASLIDNEHAFSLHPCLLLLWSQCFFLNGDTVTFSKCTDCLRKSHGFVLHEKTYNVPTLTASKTVPDTTRRIHDKAGCLFLMERATCLVVDAFLFEFDIFAYHVYYVGTVDDLFYYPFVYHCYIYAALSPEDDSALFF